MKTKFQINTMALIFAILVAVAGLTWIMPGGSYQRVEKDGKQLVVAGSFTQGKSAPQGVTSILFAPIKGFLQAGEVVIFLLVIGGAFSIINKTGAVTAAIKRMAQFFIKNPRMKFLFIPGAMVIFSLGGSVFGMCEENLAFVPIFVPLALSMGYDSIIGPLHLDQNTDEPFTLTHKLVLAVFGLSLAVLVLGVFKYQWYIQEMAAVFLALGLLAGLIGRLKVDELTQSFNEGAKDMVGVCILIAVARGILVVATDGRILDYTLNAMANVISGFHPIVAAQGMFTAETVLNFFIPSSSAKAMLTMPILGPLGDVVGVSRQIVVLAFQFGTGWINSISPTDAPTIALLGLAGIPFTRWFKWYLPMQIVLFVLSLILIVPAFYIAGWK
ncbi:MAG: hypothetical protein NTW04_01985 [Elusimicrobia bacterium]|nr:hypothetical protein [Elusimicrobiota bacterium]